MTTELQQKDLDGLSWPKSTGLGQTDLAKLTWPDSARLGRNSTDRMATWHAHTMSGPTKKKSLAQIPSVRR
jgi:hypothetical protein